MAEELDPTGGIAKELEQRAYGDRIQRNFINGVRSGVNGTPTFYVNGVRHDGGHSLRELMAAIDNA